MNDNDFIEADIELPEGTNEEQDKIIAEIAEDSQKKQKRINDFPRAKEPEQKRGKGRPKKEEGKQTKVKSKVLGRPRIHPRKEKKYDKPGRPPKPRELPTPSQLENLKTEALERIKNVLRENIDPEEKLIIIANQYHAKDLYHKGQLINLPQAAFLGVLSNTNAFDISNAMRVVGIHTRSTITQWRKNNKTFDACMCDLESESIDDLEKSSYKQALAGNAALAMFMLKAKAKDRGYGDQVAVDNAQKIVGYDYVEATEENTERPKKSEDAD